MCHSQDGAAAELLSGVCHLPLQSSAGIKKPHPEFRTSFPQARDPESLVSSAFQVQHLCELLHHLAKPDPVPLPSRDCSQHRSSCACMDILALPRVRKDQEGSNCKSCCISDQNLLCSLPGVVCICLTVQSMEPFAVHRERAREGRTPEQSSARVQLGPGKQGQNPKWQITSGSGSSENGGENPWSIFSCISQREGPCAPSPQEG